jgi:hypothetical protein
MAVARVMRAAGIKEDLNQKGLKREPALYDVAGVRIKEDLNQKGLKRTPFYKRS